MINEDAPTNATPGVAGLGVGPQGEPGVSTAVQKRRYGKVKSKPNPIMMDILKRRTPNMMNENTFAGAIVFEVSSSTFHNLTLAKRKHKHWKKYLHEDESYSEIREYANNNKGPIIIKNKITQEMRYIRYKN